MSLLKKNPTFWIYKKSFIMTSYNFMNQKVYNELRLKLYYLLVKYN